MKRVDPGSVRARDSETSARGAPAVDGSGLPVSAHGVIATEPADTDARRLLKRLRRTGDHLFTFLDDPAIPFEDNHAERMIRPAAILRKDSQSNRSDRGALTQAVLMSVYRTLHLRSHDPLRTIADAPRTRLQSGQPPPLPAPAIVGGRTVTRSFLARAIGRDTLTNSPNFV